MTESIAQAGRNDPCPCGSGKKYKKCHYQADVITQQSTHSESELNTFLRPQDPAYLWYKGLRVLVNRRDWNLLYEAFIEGSPIREKFRTVESFVTEARGSSQVAPAGGEDFTLRRFRFLDDLVFVMGVRGREEHRREELEVEVIACRSTEVGLRIYNLERRSWPKLDEEGNPSGDPPFESFACVAAALEEALARPLTIPEVKRWTIGEGRTRCGDARRGRARPQRARP